MKRTKQTKLTKTKQKDMIAFGAVMDLPYPYSTRRETIMAEDYNDACSQWETEAIHTVTKIAKEERITAVATLRVWPKDKDAAAAGFGALSRYYPAMMVEMMPPAPDCADGRSCMWSPWAPKPYDNSKGVPFDKLGFKEYAERQCKTCGLKCKQSDYNSLTCEFRNTREYYHDD